MSSSLMWKPRKAHGFLPKELKRVISRRLWDTDGSCGGHPAVVDSRDIGYLQGLRDAKIEGAEELIGLIEKHGEIELWHGS